MDTLETQFLQYIKEVDMLTPKDVILVENETLPSNKYAQYCITLKDKQFHIVVKKNGSEILILTTDNYTLKKLKLGEQLYQELKTKARVWYREEDLSKYKVIFNNQECNVRLDMFSFIQPFVLKSIIEDRTRYIGLDFLTIYGLINR